MAYVTVDEFFKYAIPDAAVTMGGEPLAYWLETASDSVDSLTFGRIRSIGFDHLTPLQQERVKKVVARLACWQHDHQETLSNPLVGYSINGVSAQIGASAGVRSVGGVMIPAHLLGLLEQTGLCCRRL